MAKVQKQLKTMLGSLSKSLSTLTKQVEKMSEKVDQIEEEAPVKKVTKAAPKKAQAKKPVAKKPAPAKKSAPAKKPAAPAKKEAPEAGTVIDTVFNAVKNSKSGIKIAELKQKTGIEGRQLSNALYKLTKRNMIKTTDRGVYTAV